jgi:hypothetical protein
MVLTYRYKSVSRPDGTNVKTPSIPVVLKGQESIEVVALLDSGADVSVLPLSIAQILGLDISGRRMPAFGVGGKIDTVDSKVSITVEKGHEHYTFDIPVKVVLDRYDLPVLLGRMGFFDQFVISFEQNKEKISLKKVSPQSL